MYTLLLLLYIYIISFYFFTFFFCMVMMKMYLICLLTCWMRKVCCHSNPSFILTITQPERCDHLTAHRFWLVSEQGFSGAEHSQPAKVNWNTCKWRCPTTEMICHNIFQKKINKKIIILFQRKETPHYQGCLHDTSGNQLFRKVQKC